MISLSELIKEVKKSKERVKRDAFLYLEPKGKDFAQCVTCRMWTGPDGNTCSIMGKTKVTGDMSCGLYVNGKPSSNLKGKEQSNVTPEQAGLVKRKVRCENCRSFDNGVCMLFKTLNDSNTELFDLDEKVNVQGCCNAQMSKND